MQSLETALYDLTGHNSFRGNQRDVVSSILNGRNVMSIAPTGSGKSLEFQLPSYIRQSNGLSTLVVSPLIALMEDQVAKSYDKLRYAAVNSLNPRLDNQKNLQMAAQNEIDLLYISPESLTGSGIIDALRGKFDMAVIDEAHCVSTWGHSFRPAYILLGEILKELDIPQYAMFTATAPERLKKQITSVLDIIDYDLFEISPIRDNIKYTLNRDEGNYEKRRQNISNELNDRLKQDDDSLHIIYTNTISDAKELLYHLKGQNIPVSLFHGQMSAENKISSMDDFKSGKSRVMVCTNAFGMGIDIPNIRTVINYKLPSSIEDYVQQTGRAGRDGSDSDAILYYNSEDLGQLYRFIQLGNPLPRSIEIFYRELKKKVDMIKEYQDSPVSYLQLLKILEGFGKNNSYEHEKNYHNSFNALVHLGLLKSSNGEVIFTAGNDVELNSEHREILQLKFHEELRRLHGIQMYVREGGISVANKYLQGNQSLDSISTELNKVDVSLLSLIQRNLITKGTLESLVSDGIDVDGMGADYFSRHPEIDSGELKARMQECYLRGYLRYQDVSTYKVPMITREGLNFLRENGKISHERTQNPEFEDNLHYFEHVEVLGPQIRYWINSDKERVQTMRTVGVGIFLDEFSRKEFNVNGKKYTGSQLIDLQISFRDKVKTTQSNKLDASEKNDGQVTEDKTKNTTKKTSKKTNDNIRKSAFRHLINGMTDLNLEKPTLKKMTSRRIFRNRI